MDEAYFRVLSIYLPGWTGENHDSKDSRCPSPDLNVGPLDHEEGRGKLDLQINFRIVTTCQKHLQTTTGRKILFRGRH